MKWTLALMQLEDLTEIQRATREHFQKGGSIVSVLSVIGGLVLGVGLAYWLSQQQQKVARNARRNDPQKLFQDLMAKVELSEPQRRVLGSVAHDLNLDQPAVLLISRALFDRHVHAWKQRRPAGNRAKHAGEDNALLVAQRALFGS
ncbi:MAG: hypothetical protein ACE5E5_14185 [Phycisphaerae bacterium]